MTLTNAQMLANLAALTAALGPWDPADVFVGVAAGVDDKGGNTAMSDVTPATGAVATRKPVGTWGTPHLLNDGRWAVDGPVCTFKAASAAESQSVTHWFYASDLAAGDLKGFEEFDNPYGLVDEFHTLSIVPRLCIDPAGNVDASIVFNG